MTITISAKGVSKRFKKSFLFKDITFTCSEGESIAVTGPNGSGKSTLLRILARLTAPSSGTVTFSLGTEIIGENKIRQSMGFCSPELALYENLTGLENLRFAAERAQDVQIARSLDKFQLKEHENKQVKFYSSGMKQRLKILCAVINRPPVLFLDEPGLALDISGKKLIYNSIESVRNNCVIILATNEADEAKLCGRRIELG
ncbi:MAG: ABC transporter ATP-binding protein [Spirochaetia bacterium]|jgi:heme exporter protein A|nr:ABC transporter ATP-binding protein [Spirochaetia bacterium]